MMTKLAGLINKMTSNRKEIISEYKAGFFRHPHIDFDSYIHIWLRDISKKDAKAATKLLAKLEENALLDEHELTFLSHALIEIAKLDKNKCRRSLNHAVYAQLTRYAASLFETSSMTFIILNLLGDDTSASASIAFDLLRILIIERAQINLCYLFSKNEHISLEQILLALWNAPIDLMHLDRVCEAAKGIAGNVYEFLTTNASFFYYKLTGAPAPQKELPADLRDAQEEALRRFFHTLSQ